MVKDIYIYDNRKNVNFLNQYIKKAIGYGFNPIILDGSGLGEDVRFNKFKSLYKHYSYNSIDFDINCFARYFAIASIHSDDLTFILSDSDVYISDKVQAFKDDSLFKNFFVGSEGFFVNGPENQISPHFSIWNRVLVNDFVNYIIEVYERNSEKDFLKAYYEEQKSKLGNTGISDMTLLHMWVNEKKVPFINSNNKENSLGIDHNISSLYCEGGSYKSFFNRKLVNASKKGGIKFIQENGVISEMAVVHFQGGYKRILNDFYNGDFIKFSLFTIYIWAGRKVKGILKK